MDSYLRRVLRIALSGVVCVLAVLAAGRIAERLKLGADDAATRARVDRDIRGAFDVMSRGVQDVARQVAAPETLDAAGRGDESAARRLFDTAEAATIAHTTDVELAVTAYGPDSRALAWAGRPSELPRDRLEGDEAWFIAQGALGLRLVYAMPVTDSAGNRIGTVASEQAIRRPSPSGSVSRADEFQFPGELVPVSLELAFEDIRTTRDPDRVDVKGPNGRHLVTAVITPSDLAEARGVWRRMTASLAEMTAAVFVLLLCGPLLDWRDARERRENESRVASLDEPGAHRGSRGANAKSRYSVAVVGIALAIIAARMLFRLASPADWSDAEIFSAAVYASPLLRPLLASPFDFLLTAATAAELVGLAFFAFEAWRKRRRHVRVVVNSPGTVFLFLAAQLVVGGVAVGVVLAQHALLADTVANTTLDLLHFSLHPWNTALTALQFAIVIWDATAVAALVLIFRTAYLPWRIARRRWSVRVAAAICWLLPTFVFVAPGTLNSPLLPALVLAALVALVATLLKGRYRHGSQAFRLTLLSIGLVLPALAFYPDVFALANRAKTQLVETRFGPQALNQRRTIQSLMQQSLEQIDAFPGLADLVSVPPGPAGSEAVTDRAFQVWRITGLAMYPVTSSVELFGPSGLLVSRFAFSLPDDLNALPTSEERVCSWDVFEEVSPFFAAERRVLSAGRAVCVNDPGGTPHVVGSIRVHAMLDYANLPFIASKSPYVELLRPTEPQPTEGVSGGDVEFAVYGWSRMPLYTSAGTAWRLDEGTFAKLTSSRAPIWARLEGEEQPYDVYLLSDRAGIYALGFPVVTLLGHMMNLAELTVVAAATFLTALLLAAIFSSLTRRATSARKLFREVRASSSVVRSRRSESGPTA